MKNNRTIENIRSTIEKGENQKKEKIASFKTQKSSIESRLEALRSQHEATDDPEEYHRISKEIEEKETSLKVLNRGFERFKEPGYFLPEDDYKTIIKDLRSQLEAVKKEHTPSIEKKLFELIEAMDSYSDEAEELQSLVDRATRLEGMNMNPPILEVRELPNKTASLYRIQDFSRAYFDRKDLIKTAKRDPKKILDTCYNNPELREIASILIGKG